MSHITELGCVTPLAEIEEGKDLSVQKLVDDDIRTVLVISLKNGAVLSKHKTAEPITVLCFRGKATFQAGEGLLEKADLQEGTLIAVEPNIEHEVTALTDAQILVTKFKRSL